MTGANVVILGSASVDFFTYVSRLPKPGETLKGFKFNTSYGGKGANQCVAARRLGANTTFIAKVGDDTWGKQYKDYLQAEGVNTQKVDIMKNETTGVAQIVVSSSGENQIVIVPGANKQLSIADVNDAESVIASADVLVCQLETPIEATIEAFNVCNGIKILNAAPATTTLPSSLLVKTTILCVNETEASLMIGKDVSTVKEAASAILELLELRCNIVIITLGKLGAVYGSCVDKKIIHVNCDEVKAVDTTGAGDAFIGALAYLIGKNKGVPMHSIVGASCHVASLSVMKEGTQTSYPVLTNLLDRNYRWNVVDM